MNKSRITIPSIAVTSALMLAIPAIAMADGPANPNCWGVVTSQLATNTPPGTVGAHASDPIPDQPGRETPRLGLHNVATELFGLEHVSQLGTLLATIDQVDATQCP